MTVFDKGILATHHPEKIQRRMAFQQTPNGLGAHSSIHRNSPTEGPRRILGGLIIRKECWSLSWRGRLLFAASALLAAFLGIFEIHPFLAVTHRVNAKILVVEGWVHNFGTDAAVQEFKTGHYERVLTTGGPEKGIGASSSIYDTDAYQSAELLIKAGIPVGLVQSVPSLFVGRNRTYNSAVTLRNWLQEHAPQLHDFNVLTEDAHARRTWLLFQAAFGKQYHVGIISVANPDYDAKRWWHTSEGVRVVIDETVAYIYSKFFFWP